MAKFSIKIPCKPYTKRFLEMNYGSPVDFSKDKTLYAEFRNKLIRPFTKDDTKYQRFKMKNYSETVDIKISEADFYQHGWELTITDIVNFNCIVENRAKTFLYVIVTPRVAFGQSLTECVGYFQDKYNFPESVWPKESIIKDCQRNLPIEKNEIMNKISDLFDKISIAKLSEKRTISLKVKKEYETAKI